MMSAEAAVVDTGVDAEIIDLRALMPLDLVTIEASVRKTVDAYHS